MSYIITHDSNIVFQIDNILLFLGCYNQEITASKLANFIVPRYRYGIITKDFISEARYFEGKFLLLDIGS